MDSDIESIRIGWWNTGLSPFAPQKPSATDRDHVAGVILTLLVEKEMDFLAIGEMSEEDCEYLSDICALDGYEFVSVINKAGKSKFDTVYVYNSSLMTIQNTEDIVKKKGTSTLKVAQRVDLVICGAEDILHLFVSHWPSRLYLEEFGADRHYLAMRLRDSVEEVINSYSAPPHIVLIGDYNDDPFGQPMSEQLMATRDIGLVEKKPHLLFNPYWNWLGGHSDPQVLRGSYFYKSGKYTEWHTFDQMIFSSAFFRENGWSLSRDSEYIVEVPDYTKMVIDRKTRFDHLPISSLIERV